MTSVTVSFLSLVAPGADAILPEEMWLEALPEVYQRRARALAVAKQRHRRISSTSRSSSQASPQKRAAEGRRAHCRGWILDMASNVLVYRFRG
jgi:hypothetical protein